MARRWRNRSGVKDVRVLVDDLNPVLRGWGNYFRTGNAAQKCRHEKDHWHAMCGKSARTV